MRVSGTVVVAALVAVLTLAIAAVVALTVLGAEARAASAITTIVALVGPTVIALLTLLRVEQAGGKVDQVDTKVAHLQEVVDGHNEQEGRH